MRIIFSNTYYLILLVVGIFVAFRFRKLDKATKIVCGLIWLGGLTEALGRVEIWYDGTNYKVYNTSFFLEFLLICLYFHFSVRLLRKHYISLYLAALGIVLGSINAYFFQPYTTALNSGFLFFECINVVLLCMIAIYQLLVFKNKKIKLQRKTHFWIPCILLFYQTITLWSWGMYEHLGDNAAEKAKVYDMMVLITNIICYLSYGVLIYFYTKMKRIPNEV